MAINRRLQFVRGNTARNNAFTGREGELTVDTTTWTLRVHDGVTPGGNALGTSNFSGDYDDLTNKPTIPADVSDLTDTGGILSSGFSGAYADLTGAPVIPTDLSDLTDDSNLIPTDISQLGDATGVIPTDVSDLTDTHNIILTLPQLIVGLATEEYVDSAVSNLVNAAPGTLDTLNELAAAIGDDPNYAATVSGLIGAKANTADLSTVATTGSYNHLTDKPFIPYDANELTDADGLFFSGSYNDLSDKPVLFSGAYADLTGKPTIPSLSTFSFGTNTITTSNGDDGITLKISGATSGEVPAFVQRTWRLADSGAIQFLDPFLETVDGEITTTKIVNWDDAFSWGDHATFGYSTFSGAYADLTGAPTTVSSFTNDAGYVASDTTGITGADQVTNMVTLTQAEYDAITPNASTVYFIVG